MIPVSIETTPTSTDVFTTELVCRNCGTVFKQHHGPETKVSDDRDGVRVVGPDHEFGQLTRVECPTCKLHKHVDVDDRYPIEDT